jgi:hypothetical protein
MDVEVQLHGIHGVHGLLWALPSFLQLPPKPKWHMGADI